MKNRELILYNNQIHRILALADHKALLINCIKLTMPKWVNTDLLSNCDSCTEEDLLKAANLPATDSLSPEKKSLVHKRYTMIAPALIVVADEYMRARAIEQAAQQYGLSHQTIRKYLCLYLAYQRLDALVQGETNFTKPLSTNEKNFRWAINKYYYSPAKHTLKAAYLFMLKEKYTDPNGTLFMAIEVPFVRVGCGNFILTNSIAFFYSLGLTSIVMLQLFLKRTGINCCFLKALHV